MRTLSRGMQLTGTALLMGLGAACAEEVFRSPMQPSFDKQTDGDQKVLMCHMPSGPANLVEVSMSALGAHLGHGDYVARYIVEQGNGAIGDGVHFDRIGDALDSAKAGRVRRQETHVASCRITIEVAAQTFTGTFDATAVGPALERLPLIIDVPNVQLQGSLEMILDSLGRPTGTPVGDLTTLAPDRALNANEALVVVTDNTNGYHGDDVGVAGFSFQSGRTAGAGVGTGIIALRVNGLDVNGNRFEPLLASAVDLRATNGNVQRNSATNGASCGFCLAGPGVYQVSQNRLSGVGLAGVLVTAVSVHLPFSFGTHPATVASYVVPASGADVRTTITNNDIRDMLAHTTGVTDKPIASGIRVLAQAQSPAGGTTPKDVQKSNIVSILDNTFTNNVFAVVVDAGFPTPVNTKRDSVDVSLSGNTMINSCENDLLVTFTRHTSALGIVTTPPPQYLVNTVFRLTLIGLNWNDAWYANLPTIGNTNTLTANGVPIAAGSVHSFNASLCRRIIQLKMTRRPAHEFRDAGKRAREAAGTAPNRRRQVDSVAVPLLSEPNRRDLAVCHLTIFAVPSWAIACSTNSWFATGSSVPRGPVCRLLC